MNAKRTGVTLDRETEPGLRASATASAGIPVSADALSTLQPHCAANTNGTLTVVSPLEAGNRHARTRLVMQLARPR